MPPTNAKRPASAVAENKPLKCDRSGGQINSTNKKVPPGWQALAAELDAARRQLEHRAEANEIIAQWRDELRRRVQWTTLKAELIGIPAEEHDALIGEIAEFKRLCAAIGWSPSGRRRP